MYYNLKSRFLLTNRLNRLLSSSSKLVLGIETSCDDTGCAVVSDEGRVLGEALYSQNIVHIRYGGVNPVIAYELHRKNIEAAANDALRNACVKINDIDAIAVTSKPGMLINLQVGVKFASYLSKKYRKPLIPIHHMEAHALVVRLFQNIEFPFLVLLISGGHCLLALANDVEDFLLLGSCLDNPPGEVMDKAARRLKLKNIPEYAQLPGGRAIELSAQKAKNLDVYKFTLPLLRSRDCNFSFSGLKDAFFRKIIKAETKHHTMGDEIIPEINDLCASFQLAIAEHLMHRTERALTFCEKQNLLPKSNKNIVISGGVACNDFIFKSIQILGQKLDCNVFRPPPKLCTDNGVMIAWNGIEKLKKNCPLQIGFDLKNIMPVAALGKSLINDVIETNIHVKVTRLMKFIK
ncbi:unnamed protein product [Diatraea saccharalis]|uniref:N(6)-L-threonylcarbamoyladenine synthase n=1 Tax=Diatraea saccharalis TaxID=40085 RepID=A0A9N9W9W4_9NEOP|nr:unnamed protein product [Diatraea saccharalis]